MFPSPSLPRRPQQECFAGSCLEQYIYLCWVLTTKLLLQVLIIQLQSGQFRIWSHKGAIKWCNLNLICSFVNLLLALTTYIMRKAYHNFDTYFLLLLFINKELFLWDRFHLCFCKPFIGFIIKMYFGIKYFLFSFGSQIDHKKQVKIKGFLWDGMGSLAMNDFKASWFIYLWIIWMWFSEFSGDGGKEAEGVGNISI